MQSAMSRTQTKSWYGNQLKPWYPLSRFVKGHEHVYTESERKTLATVQRSKTKNSTPNVTAKSGHFDSLLAVYVKHTKARLQSNAAMNLHLALKFHAKQWFNVRGEKCIEGNEALRNFYLKQCLRSLKILLLVKTSLNSTATISRNLWLSSVYASHWTQMEYSLVDQI